MELRLGVAGGALEHGGDLVVLEAFDVMQHEDHAVAGRKRGDGAFQRDAVDRTGEVRVAGAEVALGSVVFAGVDGLFERDELQALFAQVHEHEVDRQAVQPGGERALAAEAAQLAVQVQEGFLRHVFGFRNIAEHAQAERIYAPLVQGIEFGESVGIARFGALDRFGLSGNGWVAFKQPRRGFCLHR
jgi:hypothetical protein